MEWSNSITLRFIEDYKSYPVLWDTSDIDYKNIKMKKQVLTILGGKYLLNLADVKAKVKTLRSSFHREHRRLAKLIESGVKPRKWFGYNSMLFLLGIDIDDEENNSVKGTSNNDDEEVEYKYVEEEVEDEEDYPVINTQVPQQNPLELCDNKVAQNHVENYSGPKQSKRQKVSEIPSDEALILLKHFVAKDEFATYGEHVANELRKLSARAQVIVKHKINNVLYEAGMGQCDRQEQS